MKNIQNYDTFIYDHYEIKETEDCLKITYFFEIPSLAKFNPTLEIPKLISKKVTPLVKEMVFHIGLIELVSYWKCCCPKQVIIKCGYLNDEQIEWFKKLYFWGLGEFFYTNHLLVDQKSFMEILITQQPQNFHEEYTGKGSMIAIGGGKDSCVSLDLLKNEKNRMGFIINPKPVMIECAKIAGLEDNQILKIRRTIDQNLLKLNEEGYYNGHTPFSAMVAFVSLLTAYLNDKQNIILSNESSANESNIRGTKINHQYSKSFEFEQDFNDYVSKYFKIDIRYFSILRPLTEYQIGMLFSKIPQYHNVFKSCNPGSKQLPWIWCGNCPKCLFVFSLLSPFLYKEKLINIFGQDLFEKKELLQTFQELLGYAANKPFDCVGTYEEVNYAISKTILNLEQSTQKLPYLLQFYKENYPLVSSTKSLETFYNKKHNIPIEFEKKLKEYLHD